MYVARLKVIGMTIINPFQFIQQVRSEAAKVTWPTRRETGVTTLMVFAMVALATIFFFLADQIMGWGVGLMLGSAS
jgi:preprotein translocase subunit SecE